MKDFGPYHQWLGIPPEHRPPTHYRLLGLEQFESDPDAISNAADRQMTHVRSFQTGENSEVSQRILNEIAAARVCLLNAPRKAEYDAWLRGTLAPPVAVVVPAAKNTPMQSKRAKIGSTTAALAGAAVVLCLLVVVFVASRSRSNPEAQPKATKSPVAVQTKAELPEILALARGATMLGERM